MKTLAEAKQDAIAAGIHPDDLTPEVLKRYEWEVDELLQNVDTSPVQTDREVQEAVVLLREEAKNNNFAKPISRAIRLIASKFLG